MNISQPTMASSMHAQHLQPLVDIILERWTIVLPSLLLCLTAYLIPLLRNPIRHVPYVGKELGGASARRAAFMERANELYIKGYRQFKGQLFKITTPRKSTIVVVPPNFLPELRRLPEDVLSFAEAVADQTHTDYTGADGREMVLPHTVKACLTPALVRLNPSIADEVAEAIRLEMPPCADWTRINIYNKLLRIVAMVSGRVFIGPELCHDEVYIGAAINFTLELTGAWAVIDRIPAFLRPILVPRLPEIKALWSRRHAAHAFLKPVVEQRLAMEQGSRPDDMLTWLMEAEMTAYKDKSREEAIMNIAKMQLGLSFAAIHTTCIMTTNAFYNLAVMPAVVEELREEIRTVLGEHGGVFTSASLQAMKKLDSFLKETLRFHSPAATSFGRKVLKPFTLSSGQVIPAGVVVEVAAEAVSRDPDLFENPDTFDALRYYKLRQRLKDDGAAERAATQQMVSVTQTDLMFGYGRHACPGRFFAANEIKMIMANYLLRYDVKNVGGSMERYKNVQNGIACMPDTAKELEFREISA